MSDFSSVENDLRAIEAINQVDRQAALAGDTARMMSQWTDDFVLLQAAGPILRGRSTIAEAFRGVEGSVEVLETRYNAFRGSRNFANRSIHVTEQLFLVQRS